MSIRVRVQSPQCAAADYDFDGGEIVIGRAETASIVIADTRVSRQHVRLVKREDGWWAEDLGARNPTLLNGAAIDGRARLNAGDRLAIGDSFVWLLGDPAEAPPADPPRTHTAEGDPPSAAPGASRDAARMWTLNEIHRALAAPLSLAELLDVVVARCFDVLDPEEGVVMLRAADGSVAVAASRTVSGAGGAVTVPRRLVDEVMEKGRPALVLDAMLDDRFAGSKSVVATGLRSVVAAPLADAEGALGLIALFSRLAIRRFTQADLDMLVSIASAAALRVRNAALADELVARRVVEHELALAHDVQMAMLPRDMPRRPDVAVAARLEPARSVGGDLYDFVLDEDRLWLIVADVAGKSIAAALYMAIARTLFRATARGAADVADVARRMNDELARDNDSCVFVTALIGCLDLDSGVLTLVDAGHNPAVAVRPGDRPRQVDVPKCIALGAVSGAPYTAARVPLVPGETLVLYTDGITEATNPAGELFGGVRLDEALGGSAGEPPAGLVAGVMAAVERFTAGAVPDDDRTVLVVRYRPGVQSVG